MEYYVGIFKHLVERFEIGDTGNERQTTNVTRHSLLYIALDRCMVWNVEQYMQPQISH
jgi:hypothetical protein